MPIDPVCQPIATSLAELESQRDAARAALSGLAPAERWLAFAKIGELDRKLAEGQRQLDDCQRRQAARYDAELAVFDLSGGTSGARSATLWRMGDDEPAVLETTPISAGAFSFAAPPADATLGLTIQETGNPPVTGLDFRSGPLHELPRSAPSDPSARVEHASPRECRFRDNGVAGREAGLRFFKTFPHHRFGLFKFRLIHTQQTHLQDAARDVGILRA